jgi:adenylate cyclase
MNTEIERKFLVRSNDFQKNAQMTTIHQGFLCTESNGVVRIRIEETKATITIKGKAIGLERTEFEYEIPLHDAVFLLENNCIKPTIKKNRYSVFYEGFTWEIDEYMEENEGLIVAEIELPEKHTLFKKPSWIGDEVTDDPRYYNANLAKRPFKDWKSND